ncbi:MAG: glutamyl-tRNA reductase [Actinomycetes bacterium]
MSLVVVGLSHRSAPVSLLERAAVGADDVPAMDEAAVAGPHVTEALVLSTCNRVEVYADVRAFHAGVGELTALLAATAGVPVDALGPHVYVHYEDAAVQHLFQVVCGLDSMVVGEAQILGQVRDALGTAQQRGAVGRSLNELVQQALRVGKRVHAETGIDQAGSALMAAGLELAGATLGPLPGRRALVVGAGSLSALAVASLQRAGFGEIVVLNRDPDRARALASSVGGRSGDLAGLEDELVVADVVVSCTGATAVLLTEEIAGRAHARRAGRPMVVLDLALPHDVDPACGELDGVVLVTLDALGRSLAEQGATAAVDAVRVIAAEEVSAYLAHRQAARVAPTVVALRTMADEVVAAELARLDARRPDLDVDVRAELERTVRRVVDKLLHAPTVRVKEFAEEPAGLAYAEALHALFDLDPLRYREVVVADVHAVEVDLHTVEPDGGTP